MINLIFSIDKMYEQHLAVCLQSIYDNNRGNNFHIFLLAPKGHDIGRKLLHTIINLRFEYTVLSVEERLFSNFHISYHVSLATYYRLIIGKLLPLNVHKAIYLDSDLVVMDDLTDLWQTDITEHAIAAVDEKAFDRFEALGIPTKFNYFNAGVLLINVDYFRNENLFEKALTYYNTNKINILWWDQDILNGLLYNKRLKLPSEWNVKTDEFDRASSDIIPQNIKVIHFTGSSKPWHYRNNHPKKDVYFYYLNKTKYKYYSPFRTKLKEYFLKTIAKVKLKVS